MRDFADARWYAVRTASSRKPATYRCPFCGEQLPALRPHLLVLPEGEGAGRRHAHLGCVKRAREQGRLPFREDIEPPRPGLFRRLRDFHLRRPG